MDEEDGNSQFCEFRVEITSLGWSDKPPVLITVWAAGLEEAMTCGEVLSGVYLDV